MVNGAPGSAWASLTSAGGIEEVVVAGVPAHDDPTRLTDEHLFDLASLTKIFTTVTALRLVDDGALDLDEPVASVLSVGSGRDAETITLRHLLTHTSGLPAEGRLWRTGMRGEQLRDAVLGSALLSRPGDTHRYSDVGFIAIGELLERVSGRRLDALVGETAARIGAEWLTWTPDAARAVAAEVQPHRGLVRGEVHDELAAALERPAGHAGLFGTVHDVAALARVVRDDGVGAGGRVLSADTARLLREPVVQADGFEQAVGLRVRDANWMGRADAVGHTGFTGTAFAVSPRTGDYGVLLLNRVHTTREDADASDVRRSFFAFLAA